MLTGNRPYLTRNDLKTGDLMLFVEHTQNCAMRVVDNVIRWFTKSKYSHVGIVIVNPPWAPKDIYVWDSSRHNIPDPQDNKIKFGIALVPITHYESEPGSTLYIRKPIKQSTYRLFTTDFLAKLHNDVYGKHYDLTIGHWLAGYLKVLIPRSTKTFFCSAFVSYTLVQAGILDEWTDWTVVSPAQLSSENDQNLGWIHKYGPDTLYNTNTI